MATVLLVDDEMNMRRSMALLLGQQGYAVREAAGAADALEVLRSARLDLVLTDVRMGTESDGTMLLRAIKERDPEVEVVLVTGFGTIPDAVDAMKSGAYDYLTKPVDPERLLITVRRAIERSALAREVRQLRAQLHENDEIVGTSRAMQAVLATVAQLAQTDSTVLITGESGTGKELVARALHRQSPRRHGRFVPINCGGIPETMLETELFGHRRGAFTGAATDKRGLVEEAHRGVLFLDEVGDMPVSMQMRLLRFLQGGEVRRVGDTETRSVDVRLVAATHRVLEDEVAAGRFREDFFYRINVVGVRIPALRERPEDVEPLANHFVRRFAARMRRNLRGVTPAAAALMTGYSWPGNVRELENVIERAVNIASGEFITEGDLPATLTVNARGPGGRPRVTEDERAHLVRVLERCRWNRTRAASALGMDRTTLWRKLREYRIEA